MILSESILLRPRNGVLGDWRIPFLVYAARACYTTDETLRDTCTCTAPDTSIVDACRRTQHSLDMHRKSKTKGEKNFHMCQFKERYERNLQLIQHHDEDP